MAVTAVVIPQASTAIAQTIYPATATSASGSAGPFPVDFFSSAGITVVVTSVVGTLDVYVQRLLPDGSTYDDVAAFAQWGAAVYTTTGTYSLSFVNGGNTINQQKSSALAANSVLTVNFAGYWRIAWTIGTGPASFGIYGDFRA